MINYTVELVLNVSNYSMKTFSNDEVNVELGIIVYGNQMLSALCLWLKIPNLSKCQCNFRRYCGRISRFAQLDENISNRVAFSTAKPADFKKSPRQHFAPLKRNEYASANGYTKTYRNGHSYAASQRNYNDKNNGLDGDDVIKVKINTTQTQQAHNQSQEIQSKHCVRPTKENVIETVMRIDDNKQIEEMKSGGSISISLDDQLLAFEEEQIEFNDFPQINFGQTFKVDGTFRVIISQIHSPYKFWFHRAEYADDINILMDSLEYV